MTASLWVGEGGHIAFMETIAIKITIDTITLSNVFPISVTSSPKSLDFLRKVDKPLFNFL